MNNFDLSKYLPFDTIQCYKYIDNLNVFLISQDGYNLHLYKCKTEKKTILGSSIIPSKIIFIETLDQRTILIGHLNGYVSIYDTNENFSFLNHRQNIFLYKYFIVDKIKINNLMNFVLFGSSKSNQIFVYQYFQGVKNLELVCDFQRNDMAELNSFCFLMNYKENDKFFVASQTNKIHLFEIFHKENHKYIKTSDEIKCLDYNTNNSLLIGISRNNNVFIWNIEKEELEYTIPNESSDILYYKLEVFWFGNNWCKLNVLEGNYKLAKLEIYDKINKIGVCILQGNSLTNSSFEVGCKEVLEILYISCINRKNKELCQFLVTTSDDQMIRIWNLKNFELFRGWKASQLPITSITYLIDGENLLLISSSYNNVIQVWDFYEGDIPIQSLTSHTLDVNCLLFIEKDPLGIVQNRYLVSGSADKSIILWKFHSSDLFTKQSQVKACDTSIIALEFFCIDNEPVIATGSRDKTIKIFGIPKLNFIIELIGHKDSVKTLLKYERPEGFYTLFYNKALLEKETLDHQSSKIRGIIRDNESPYKNSFKTSNSFLNPKITIFLISGSMDKTIKIWDVRTGLCLYSIFGHDGYVNNIIWLNEENYYSKFMISASQDGTIKIWDMINLKCLETFNVNFPRFSSALKYIKKEKCIVFTNYKGEIKFKKIFDDFKVEAFKDKIINLYSEKMCIMQKNEINEQKKCIIF